MKDSNSILSRFDGVKANRPASGTAYSTASSEQGGSAPACRVVLANNGVMLREVLKKLFHGSPHFEVIEVTREGGVPLESLVSLASDIVVLDAEAFEKLLARKGKGGDLSLRQLQILAWIAEGKTSKEIAELLQLSFRTVDHHRAAIKKKLGLKRMSELIKYSIEKQMSGNSGGETGTR